MCRISYRELRDRLIWRNLVRFLVLYLVAGFVINLYVPDDWVTRSMFACTAGFYLLEYLYLRARLIELYRAVSMYDTLVHNPYSMYSGRVRAGVRLNLSGTEGRRRVLRYAELRLGPAAIEVVPYEQLYGWEWLKALFIPGLK